MLVAIPLSGTVLRHVRRSLALDVSEELLGKQSFVESDSGAGNLLLSRDRICRATEDGLRAEGGGAGHER